MKKSLYLSLFSLILLSCSGGGQTSLSTLPSEPSSGADTSEEVLVCAMEVEQLPVGAIEGSDYTRYYWSYSEFPKRYCPEVDFSRLVPGDLLAIRCTGGWIRSDIQGGDFKIVGEFLDYEITLGRVEKVSLTDGKINAPSSALSGMKYQGLAEGRMLEDGRVPLVEYGEISEGYLVYSASTPTLARALLTYDPRA